MSAFTLTSTHVLLSVSSCLCSVWSDVAAAEDTVKFTPGKKQSKFETLMTKEEIEEEQRSVRTLTHLPEFMLVMLPWLDICACYTHAKTNPQTLLLAAVLCIFHLHEHKAAWFEGCLSCIVGGEEASTLFSEACRSAA